MSRHAVRAGVRCQELPPGGCAGAEMCRDHHSGLLAHDVRVVCLVGEDPGADDSRKRAVYPGSQIPARDRVRSARFHPVRVW